MNHLARARAKHAAAVQRTTGERLLWMPQAQGRDDSVAGTDDPTRPRKEITGTVTARPTMGNRVGNGADSAENIALAAAKWRVSWPAALALDVRAGDLVQRLDEPGQPVLRLAKALPIPGRVIHPADQVS